MRTATSYDSMTISGYALVLGAAVLWGSTGTSQALAPKAAHPLAVGSLRLLIGSVTLLVMARLRGTPLQVQQWPRKPLIMSVLGVAAYQLTFFAAVRLAGVAIGTVVGVGSAPLWGGLLGWMMARERVTLPWLLATAAAIAGCVILLWPTDGAPVVSGIGLALALAAGGSFALYTASSKRLLAEYPSDAVVAVIFALGAVLLLPLLFVTDLRWLAQPNGWLAMLHLGVMATGVAYWLFARGLRSVPVATTLTLSLAEPLTAATLGIWLLGEPMTRSVAVGMALVLVGLLLVALWRT